MMFWENDVCSWSWSNTIQTLIENAIREYTQIEPINLKHWILNGFYKLTYMWY